MTKGTFIKCLAVLAAAAYLLGMSGFNVHSCSESGEVFVSSLIEGATCQDFHPEHHCHSACCDNEEYYRQDRCALSETDCCSNQLFLLAFAGSIQDDNHQHAHHHCICHCGHCPLAAELGSQINFTSFSREAVPLPRYCLHGISDSRAVLNIWRL